MFDLVYNNNFARPTFPDRLLLGIFWEETFFNNIHQYGLGSGVGFGQVEPAEFWKLKEYGLVLPVYTVQRKNSKGETYKKTYAARALTDVESVKATAGALMFLKKKLAVQACLEGYGGVQWARDHPQERPTAAERLQIIEGWKACAVALEPCRPYGRDRLAPKRIRFSTHSRRRRASRTGARSSAGRYFAPRTTNKLWPKSAAASLVSEQRVSTTPRSATGALCQLPRRGLC